MSSRRKLTAKQVEYLNITRENKQLRNQLALIAMDTEVEFKGKIAASDLEQFRFFIQQLFPGIQAHESIFFAYKRKGEFKQFSLKMEQLNDNVLKRILMLGRRNHTYISQNTFVKVGDRATQNACSSKAIVIDLDYHTIAKFKDLSPEQMVQVLKNSGVYDKLPPSFIYSSGRGLCLVFLLNFVALYKNDIMQRLRKQVTEALIQLYLPFGVDISVKDASRVNRIPGTTNPKVTGMISRIDVSNITNNDDICDPTIGIVHQDLRSWRNYELLLNFEENNSLLQFDEEYNKRKVSFKPASKPPTERNKKAYILDFEKVKNSELKRYNIVDIADILMPNRHKKNKFNKPYPTGKPKKESTHNIKTLNEARIHDFFILAIIRSNTGKEVCRRNTLYCCSNAYANIGYIYPATEEFIRLYDHDFIYQELDKLNQINREPLAKSEVRAFAKYASKKAVKMTNAEIIELLQIDPIEQHKMKTLIESKEKQRRYSKKRSQERAEKKNEKLAVRMEKILEGKAKGWSNRQIAKDIGVDEKTVRNMLKAITDKDTNTFIENTTNNQRTPITLESTKISAVKNCSPQSFDLGIDLGTEYLEIEIEEETSGGRIYRVQEKPGLKKKKCSLKIGSAITERRNRSWSQTGHIRRIL